MIIQRIDKTGQGWYSGDSALLTSYSMEVEQVGGSGATWIVNLEGSLDGNNYTPILTHTERSPGDKQIVSIGAGAFPCRFRRVNCVALSLGSAQYLNVRIEGSS